MNKTTAGPSPDEDFRAGTVKKSMGSTKRLLNIGLRALSLGCKFSLVFFLARFLTPAEVGIYGLLAATIGYGIYVVGLEFYTYSARELVIAPLERRAAIICNQFVVYCIWYLVAGVVIALLTQRGILPEKYFWWLLALLIFEHLAQELNRILIALEQQIFAGVVLFVRIGLWAGVVVVIQFVWHESRTINVVLTAWLLGVAAACCLAAARVFNQLPRNSLITVDFNWILKGIKVALPLFIASIAVKGMSTFDRYFIEDVAGLEILGAYVLYAGMAAAIISFIDAGIVDFAYPKLIAAASSRDLITFHAELSKLRKSVWSVAVILTGLSGLAALAFVQLLQNEVYEENIYLFGWILVFSFISAVSTVPHLALYALGQDRIVVASQIAGFTVFLTCYFTLHSSQGIAAVLMALCAGWGCVFLWKTLGFKLINPIRNQSI